MKEARHILSDTLSERVAMNPRYSLRAFARDLGISPQLLSNVMNGKRGLSPSLADGVTKKIGLSEYEKSLFMESLRAGFSRSQTQRIIARSKLQELKQTGPAKNLELDLFKAISNWYHFALLELIKITGLKNQRPEWFSKNSASPKMKRRRPSPDLRGSNSFRSLKRDGPSTRTS